MGAAVIPVKVRARGEVVLRALVDACFYGDLIARPEAVEGADVKLKHERVRVLPDGGRVSVKYGVGEVEGMVTDADVEVWEGLRTPPGVDALIGNTVLEKLGLRVNPRTGQLERVELYLL
ncbi:MAG: hypothetical protein QXF46_06220 [Thermofilaceae archaeon]